MPYTLDVLEGAEDDARGFDEEERYMWVAAKERLRANPTPTFSLSDARFTSGPPILCYVNIGASRVIVVDFKHVPPDETVTVIRVKTYLYDDGRPTR